jgi:hypothetical protein
MQNTLVGFTHHSFRVFWFDRRGDDNIPNRCDVRADPALTRTDGIRVQELPLLCRGLETSVEASGVQSLTFAESDMRACAHERDAVRRRGAKKQKPWRKPAGASVSGFNKAISETNNYENTPVI